MSSGLAMLINLYYIVVLEQRSGIMSSDTQLTLVNIVCCSWFRLMNCHLIIVRSRFVMHLFYFSLAVELGNKGTTNVCSIGISDQLNEFLKNY